MTKLRILAISLALFGMCSSTQLMASSKEDDEAFAKKITGLIDKRDYGYAKAAALKYIELEPDAAPIMRQVARIILKQGYEVVDDIIGFRYTEETETLALQYLNDANKIEPDHPETLALLLHVHAVQNNVKEGQRVREIAQAQSEKAPWLNFNSAQLSVREKKYKQAADYVSSAKFAEAHKKLSTTEYRNLYASSWDLRRKIGVIEPKTDPNPQVSKGLMTRVLYGDLIETLSKTDPEGKPIMVVVTSQDTGCGPCNKDLKVLAEFAQKSKDKGNLYDIIYVSMEPWGNISNGEHDTSRILKLKGVPHYSIIHKGNYIYGWGGSNAKANDALINQYRKVLRDGKPSQKVLPWKDHLLDLVYTDFVEMTKKTYNDHYAMAYGIDGKKRFKAIATTHDSQAAADEAALSMCKSKASNAGSDLTCTIYSQGKTIVDPLAIARNDTRRTELKVDNADKTEQLSSANASQNNTASNNSENKLQRDANKSTEKNGAMPASANDAIREYKKIDRHFKALAFATNGSVFATGLASEALTQTIANTTALENCEDNKLQFDIGEACELHTIGSVLVEDKTVAGIEKITARQQKRNIKKSKLKTSYAKYRKFSTDKAYAISYDDQGNWVNGIAFGKRGVEKAKAQALEKCETKRESKNLPNPCQVLIVNTKFAN